MYDNQYNDIMPKSYRCLGYNKSGRRCRRRIACDSGYCPTHAPSCMPAGPLRTKQKAKPKHRASAAVRMLFKQRADAIEAPRRAAAKAAMVAMTVNRYADACLCDIETMIRYSKAFRKQEKERYTASSNETTDQHVYDELFPLIIDQGSPTSAIATLDQYQWATDHGGYITYSKDINILLNFFRFRIGCGYRLAFKLHYHGREFHYQIMAENNPVRLIQHNIDTDTQRTVLVTNAADVFKAEPLPAIFRNTLIETCKENDSLAESLRKSPVYFESLDPKSQTFATYKKLFDQETRTFEIYNRDGIFKAILMKIERVWSKHRASMYDATKQMLYDYGRDANESIEWHGSHKNDLYDIARNGGLSPKYAKPGRYFGRGVYTSQFFAYCMRRGYCYSADDTYTIGLVRVLRGRAKRYDAPLNVDITSAGPNHDSILAMIDGTTMTVSYHLPFFRLDSIITFKVEKL